jgi:hypothetical protein
MGRLWRYYRHISLICKDVFFENQLIRTYLGYSIDYSVIGRPNTRKPFITIPGDRCRYKGLFYFQEVNHGGIYKRS